MDIVRYLLDHGANPDSVDRTGITPLHEAVKRGNPFPPPCLSQLVTHVHCIVSITFMNMSSSDKCCEISDTLGVLRLVDEERENWIAIMRDRFPYLC